MRAGTQVGAYQVLHRIGNGGMGAVYLAEHTVLRRRAAIKLLHAEYSTRADIVRRFFNEARAATAIEDPGIVQIFDFGNTGDGSAYIVMELLNGESLDQRLRRLRALPVVEALRIMRQVASTLGAAHHRGIVHRDLKPENIFMVRDPEVPGGERAKILDFGIAKLDVSLENARTQTQAMLGTPAFMSPEQCRGAGHVDHRSDIYAMGCVLYALVTGRAPFEADGAGDIIAMHLREQAPAPSTLRTSIPAELDAIVLRCLAKDPASRFDRSRDLAAALDGLLCRGAIGDLAGVSDSLPASGISTETTLSTAAAVRPGGPGQSRSRAALYAGIFGAVLTAGIAGAVLNGRHPAAIPPPTAPASIPTAVPVRVSVLDPSPAPDPTAKVADQIRAALRAFGTWSKVNAGGPCPPIDDLTATHSDPWGHSLALTCEAQPADQQIGVISAGPDGRFGTADDVLSWRLRRDAAESVRGPRWGSKAAVAAPPPPVAATPPVTPRAVMSTRPLAPKLSPAGMRLDEDGMPVNR